VPVTLPLIVALLTAVLLVMRHRKIHVYDGFDAGGEQSSRFRMVSGSFRTQPEILRAERSAGEITVRSRDRREEASDDGSATERDEWMEAWWLFGHTGRAYRYSFSGYLRADFPIAPQRSGNKCATGAVAGRKIRCWRFDIKTGELTVTRQDESRSPSCIRRNRKSADGRLNGETIVNYKGATLYQEQRGYPAHGYVYFKMGLYRDELQQPMTIYVDEYRKDKLSR
jgi:hypothetical protein